MTITGPLLRRSEPVLLAMRSDFLNEWVWIIGPRLVNPLRKYLTFQDENYFVVYYNKEMNNGLLNAARN